MQALIVLSLSDSFAAMWAPLAAECGLELIVASDASAFARAGAVGVIVGGGVERSLADACRTAAGQGTIVAAVGAEPDHHLAAAVVRAGADDYFALPGDAGALRSWVRDNTDALRSRDHRAHFAASEAVRYRFEGILGTSRALRAALDRAARVIPHAGVTVLLTGQTGTGKELVARAIHYNGPRREAPFVDVNCAAIPDQLLESELFGHEKGAFTDATAAKPGLFELANGGTLFLDEIGHLPLGLQGKLLRALEERTVRRLGATKNVPVDVRLIAATHVDLASASRRGEFREDLYHRINVVPIELPSLSERREDIGLLARHFLARFAEEYGMPQPTLSPDGERALVERPWPGNVRELRNVMERAVLLATSDRLGPDEFAEEQARAGAPGELPFPTTLETLTRAAGEAMLRLCGGNKSDAARRLGISRARLQRILDARDADASERTETDHED